MCMSGMESDEEKFARLRAIFDREHKIETDEDLLELAKLVEDESDETDNWVDHDLDYGDVH